MIFEGARDMDGRAPRSWLVWVRDGIGLVLAMVNAVVWPLLIWALL
jgi:hypothetical protein